MRTQDLVNEYLALRSRTGDVALRRLAEHGIPAQSINLVGPVPLRIALQHDRHATAELYQPDPGGRLAWVLPVRTADSEWPGEWIETAYPEDVISQGPILDLIAFSPAAPGRYALRVGAAAVLGAIEPQYLAPPPVPVHRDVMTWLRNCCRGIMLLTRDPSEAGRILRHCNVVEAEDADHEAELRRLVMLPPYVNTTVKMRPVTTRRAG
jgi:hypothetical protein